MWSDGSKSSLGALRAPILSGNIAHLWSPLTYPFLASQSEDTGIYHQASKHETSTQCWLDVRPPSTTLAQHKTTDGHLFGGFGITENENVSFWELSFFSDGEIKTSASYILVNLGRWINVGLIMGRCRRWRAAALGPTSVFAGILPFRTGTTKNKVKVGLHHQKRKTITEQNSDIFFAN